MWLVPLLRFPEFTEEWKEHCLAEYLDFKNGLNPSANKFGSGIKFISVMDILNNNFITYDCIRTSVKITQRNKWHLLLKRVICCFNEAPKPWKMLVEQMSIWTKIQRYLEVSLYEEKRKRNTILCSFGICWQVPMPGKRLFLWVQERNILISDKTDWVK